ncbi:MAG: hypothetical protein ACN4GW_04290 [Desulforhopalus sp.]
MASIFTATQAFFLFTGGKTLCFNNGCDIVDAMTMYSPLVFNLAGFVYFQTLFWFLLLGRKGSDNWHNLAGLLLLAGLGAEAVLVFFQYSIAGVFCSYCLVIFLLVVLLNMLCGLQQIFRGAVVFTAVALACFSLQFSAGATSGVSLDGGSLAQVNGGREDVDHYLFFSATCGHCEQVIEILGQENSCNVRFNPVEKISGFQFDGAEYLQGYEPEINFNFLKSLSITEVPVLVVKDRQETRILKGGQRIEQYLGENCRAGEVIDFSGTSNVSMSGYSYLPGTIVQPDDDACALTTDCTVEESADTAGKQ